MTSPKKNLENKVFKNVRKKLVFKNIKGQQFVFQVIPGNTVFQNSIVKHRTKSFLQKITGNKCSF